MPAPVGRGDVQALLDDGALLIEVLQPREYARAHLPGALNIPAPLVTPASVEGFDRARPTIVYCYDLQCDLSPRTARLLERYGFEAVFDYEAGKADWLAYGLPYEGDGTPVAADHLEACLLSLPDETVGDVLVRMDDEGFDTVVVVDESDIVLGAAGRAALEQAGAPEPVESHMRPGPATYRPDVPLHDLARTFERKAITELLITTSSGRLLGRITAARVDADAPEADGPVLVRAEAGLAT